MQSKINAQSIKRYYEYTILAATIETSFFQHVNTTACRITTIENAAFRPDGCPNGFIV